ncbi:hypothetical protein [Oryza sativa Japonica Group]|uniref:Uncharacterized protein n=1 Tax=Oryza sativa subsp. japonica TaxID=39947 RepID=Q5QMD3_ORYSJ|nr:hypothetical protein [Oryza sativa Japonica Group]
MPSDRHGTARQLVGRAWTGGAAHRPARPGTKCLSGHAGPMTAGPCPAMPGPGRAGRALWPYIELAIPKSPVSAGSATSCAGAVVAPCLRCRHAMVGTWKPYALYIAHEGPNIQSLSTSRSPKPMFSGRNGTSSPPSLFDIPYSKY